MRGVVDNTNQAWAAEVACHAVSVFAIQVVDRAVRSIRRAPRLGLVLVHVMPKMADLNVLLVPAVTGGCPPDKLEGQQSKQKDHESFAHQMILTTGRCRRLPLLARPASLLATFFPALLLLDAVLPQEVDQQQQGDDDDRDGAPEDVEG
jgi:hypothetical protein